MPGVVRDGVVRDGMLQLQSVLGILSISFVLDI